MPNEFKAWWDDHWMKLNGRSAETKALMIWNAAQVGKTKAMQDILAERQRQIEVYSTPEQDDRYQQAELASAAAVYLMPSSWPHWPWKEHPLPKQPESNLSYRRNLIKAAALLVAEIERLDRIK